ncbi:MAG: peptidase S41 [delta proteobacterium MLS_D]|jgi:carboxyl-terminal processing protease|nr:MAG: peptidase S41 [delta proteobacterium MLS_D]
MTRWFKKKKAGTVFLVVLSALLLSALCFRGIPAFSADETTYKNLKKFSEILDLVERNYVEETDSDVLIQGAIEGMMKNLDPHSTYMTEEMYKELQVDTRGEFGGLGIVISMKDGVLTVVSPVEDTPAFAAGIMAGDAIVKINGEDTKDLTIMDAVHKLRGPRETKVTITIMREGFDEPKDYTITRDIIKIKSVKHRILQDDIGYIRISSFQENTTDDLETALENLRSSGADLRGLVVDLRNNPGGLLDQAVDAADLFLASGIIVTTKGRDGRITEKKYRARNQGIEPNVPIIILVNGGSASGSEILAGALRDNRRAMLLGTQTFGKGVMQMIIPLRDGSAVKLTTAKYYTPSGVSIQAKGITPDFVVEYNRAEPAAPEREQVREKDLEGHIEGDLQEMPEGPEHLHRFDEKDFEIDNQLQRAIDLIKGWAFMKTMQKG